VLVLFAIGLVAAALAHGAASAPAVGTAPTASSLSTPPPSGALEFLALGDWGRGGSAAQRNVASAMAEWATAHPVRFVVSTGDNFYSYGVASVTDPQWKTSFEDVYAARSLQVPWFVALGNHDARGSVEAQIEYSTRSPRWRMPARTYTFTQTAGGARIQFFVLDTSPFLATYRSILSRTKVSGQDPAAQRAWLEKELAASTADWKIVVGHHPIRSCGPHGDSAELVRDVLPLLERYGVAVYLNGHDHSLQHLRSDGIDFFTSGGGSDVTRVSPDSRTVWAEATSGFIAFRLTAEAIHAAIVDAAGAVRHEATIPRAAARFARTRPGPRDAAPPVRAASPRIRARVFPASSRRGRRRPAASPFETRKLSPTLSKTSSCSSP
jgi:acid phosphatase